MDTGRQASNGGASREWQAGGRTMGARVEGDRRAVGVRVEGGR